MIRKIVSIARRIKPANEPDPRLTFALNEISELRQQVRSLLAQQPSARQFNGQTLDSFNYQWEHLSEGVNMSSDPEFRANSRQKLAELTRLPMEWYSGKRVLDAGCGNGRWSGALCDLGAEVIALDASAAGVKRAQKTCSAYPTFQARQHNLLDPIPEKNFDLVWCYGVAHHTGDTRRALGNVAAAVMPGGYLFGMIYGEPCQESHFAELNDYTAKRREFADLNFDKRAEFLRRHWGDELLNAWFDALSPQINDLHRFDEIAEWLSAWGFEKPTRTAENRNHHFVARRVH